MHAGEMVAPIEAMAINDVYITVVYITEIGVYILAQGAQASGIIVATRAATEARTRSMVAVETWSRLASISPLRLQ